MSPLNNDIIHWLLNIVEVGTYYDGPVAEMLLILSVSVKELLSMLSALYCCHLI